MVWDASDEYSTDHGRCGIALVIINETFRGHKGRTGSHLDADNLSRTFSKLGFEVRLVKDCTLQELKEVLSSGEMIAALLQRERERERGRGDFIFVWKSKYRHRCTHTQTYTLSVSDSGKHTHTHTYIHTHTHMHTRTHTHHYTWVHVCNCESFTLCVASV